MSRQDGLTWHLDVTLSRILRSCERDRAESRIGQASSQDEVDVLADETRCSAPFRLETRACGAVKLRIHSEPVASSHATVNML